MNQLRFVVHQATCASGEGYQGPFVHVRHPRSAAALAIVSRRGAGGWDVRKREGYWVAMLTMRIPLDMQSSYYVKESSEVFRTGR